MARHHHEGREPDLADVRIRRPAADHATEQRVVTDQPLGRANALALQRLAGNRAVTQLVVSRSRDEEPVGDAAVQRWSVMGGLKKFGNWVSGLFGGGKKKDEGGAEGEQEQEESPPPVQEETDRGEVPKHPAKARPGFDLAGGQEILTKAFGDVKAIVPGKIQVLDQAEFQVAYDKIYGSGPYSWDKYVKPKYGSLNGFAYDGTNYINKASAGLHTIVHEMLHNNAASDWIPTVGSRFNEGTTEILTQQACALFSEPAPVCYPNENPVVSEALKTGLPKADLAEAYLKGGAKKKVADWVDANCALPFAKVKEQMEAQNWDAAKAGLAPKASATPDTTAETPTATPVKTP